MSRYYTRSTGATRASNAEARQATFNPRNRPGMLCEVLAMTVNTNGDLIGHNVYTGTLWYHGRQVSRDQAATIINDALDQYTANPRNPAPIHDELIVHDGRQGCVLQFWRITRITAI